MRKQLVLLIMAPIMTCVWGPRIVHAHRIHLHAHVDGHAIVGNVVDGANRPVPGLTIAGYGPSGVILAQAVTDGRGRFTLAVTAHGDWRIVAAGNGHFAEHLVPADELPQDLPLEGSARGRVAPLPSTSTATSKAGNTPHIERGEGQRIAELNRQIIGLRRDVASLRTSLRWQDITGAVGYILGLMGIGCYWLSRRHGKRAARGRDT